MTDVAVVATGIVVTVKVVDMLPAGTVIEGGTVAAVVLLLCKVTIAPPVGATPLSVTVPVELFPPTTEVGLNDSADRVGALTVSVAAAWLTPYVPEILTEVFAATAAVVTVNVADVVPVVTVTLAGTCATELLLLDNATTAPPFGAAALRVTVPVEEVPPSTDVGFSVREVRVVCGGVTVNVAV